MFIFLYNFNKKIQSLINVKFSQKSENLIEGFYSILKNIPDLQDEE